MGHGTSLNPNFPCSNHRRRRFGHDGAGAFATQTPATAFSANPVQKNDELIQSEQSLDGLYLLHTSLEPAQCAKEQVLGNYKNLLHSPILSVAFPGRKDRCGSSSSNLQAGFLFRIIGDGAKRFLQSRVKTHFRVREQSDQRGVCGAGDGGLD
jgi:hypothetical protein